ncbi:MAG: tRNA (adenosine(37)-N6)-threonylcarbamoyltransferase complex ATPase subunit type 1 TsaE [Oscillatoriales cyanobacterium RM1_1_9]|nr:tRNA (adenosine(37)-N6)-threonylcarbamoyltransferase complex ATPase subunit type 1 TsaE [Oscillatoriales cyanobacterium SM2_3_0]NJO47559.1 tRNA (adenosine(37)-N6)-threonylcarbamoyltransferase complex ATPase subunit type 1 TsaE [Oscillatoriales cyanobacterium RM2_1_1]NJO72096.1 tRNA (adenosine(37)-N6)-threonylcarbamoyltransferase complex ATPase subunit type 1 TsaE [Oscillatoriales cyanobacterium RM1_1_9]
MNPNQVPRSEIFSGLAGVLDQSTLDQPLFLPDGKATYGLGVELGRYCGKTGWLPPGIVLLLTGDLGSGKTTLVKGIGEGLGIAEPIDSPTFTLINEYTSGRMPLYHIDLYRLTPAEVGPLNLEIYWEGLEVEPGIVAIEWAERLGYFPPNWLQINLTHESAGRQMRFRVQGH